MVYIMRYKGVLVCDFFEEKVTVVINSSCSFIPSIVYLSELLSCKDYIGTEVSGRFVGYSRIDNMPLIRINIRDLKLNNLLCR